MKRVRLLAMVFNLMLRGTGIGMTIQTQFSLGNSSVAVWGKGQGEPLVVFMAGGLCDHRAWLPQLEAIGESRQVLALDPRGCGMSKGAGPYNISQQADDVAAVITSIGKSSAVLVSHSIGGYTTLLLNHRYPHLVRATVFVDVPLSEAGANTTALVEALKQADSLVPLTGMVDSMSALAPESIRAVIRDMMLTRTIEVAVGMLSDLEIVAENIKGLLAEVAGKPCLAIWPGPKPMGGDPGFLTRIAPTIQQQFFDGAGHFVQLEQPETVVLLLNRFISGLP